MNEDEKSLWAAYHKEGEWKEYHSNDIAEIKFMWGALGFVLGAGLSACGTAWLFVHWVKVAEAEDILEVYTLEEILDENDLTEADVLCLLVNEELVNLPEPLPLHFDD